MNTQCSEEDSFCFQKTTREFLKATREAFGLSDEAEEKRETSDEPK